MIKYIYLFARILLKQNNVGLKRIRHNSNPETSVNKSFEKCYECGKILASSEIYDSKYCRECAEKIRDAKSKSYDKCPHCGVLFPNSGSKYCPDCANKIRICVECNNEFVFDNEKDINCPLCLDSISKECIICEKKFIPQKDYYKFCTSCYDKYYGDPNITSEISHENEDFDEIKNNESSDYDLLISDLDENKPAKKMQALESLFKLSNEEAVLILIDALKNKNSNIRWKVARQLCHIKSKKSVDALINALKDTDSIVKTNAAWSLGEIGDKKQ